MVGIVDKKRAYVELASNTGSWLFTEFMPKYV